MIETIGSLFKRCVDGRGTRFHEAEAAIVRMGAAALPFLKAQYQSNADPVARQTAFVLMQQIAGRRKVHMDALKHLDKAGVRSSNSARATPRSDILASTLKGLYGSRPAAYLALHLQKNPDWPGWKVASVSHYLSLVDAPQALPAVVRFGEENSREDYEDLVKLAHSSYSPEAISKAQQRERDFQLRKKSRE